MIVEEIMIRDVVTMFPNDPIEKAITLLKEHRVRHLLIINDKKQLLGIVSDRDLKAASPSILHENTEKETFLLLPIQTIMTKNCITAHPLDFVEDVASVFYQQKIGCLPILENDELVGIITETDILHTLVELTGAHQPSSQIEIEVENITGKLAEIASLFSKHNINIVSILVYPSKREHYKILVFRILTIDPMFIITELKKEGYHVLWPNLPGITR